MDVHDPEDDRLLLRGHGQAQDAGDPGPDADPEHGRGDGLAGQDAGRHVPGAARLVRGGDVRRQGGPAAADAGQEAVQEQSAGLVPGRRKRICISLTVVSARISVYAVLANFFSFFPRSKLRVFAFHTALR